MDRNDLPTYSVKIDLYHSSVSCANSIILCCEGCFRLKHSLVCTLKSSNSYGQCFESMIGGGSGYETRQKEAGK